jgi:hypothetical protein
VEPAAGHARGCAAGFGRSIERTGIGIGGTLSGWRPGYRELLASAAQRD